MADYEDRLLRVLDYIHDNPAGDLSLDRLADVAAMSRFHWHRVFNGMTGETCAQAIRRIRLNRAACWLVQTDWPIAQVAARCGYPSVPSFSRAFAAAYGLPPGRFRDSGAAHALLVPTKPGEKTMYNVEITDQAARRLAALPHTGPYIEIGRAFESLGALCAARGLWPQVTGMAGVYYDDPDATPATDLRSHAGVIIGPDTVLEDPLVEVVLPAGPGAVLHFKGPYAGLKAAYDYLFGDWLPKSGRDPADAACYELYLNSPMDTAPEDLLTDICMPLR
ncbi:AraC family transcriptional regulator [Actibacterium ureilyticum]|uniref:AraC family transcriptional regulator n=1 Tax=Actibacterium ureilyticum TaxID=1590614 RepID=UPI000BAAF94D|nr:AraC family transcriptional regulator [Actibacterium ureilyticum]